MNVRCWRPLAAAVAGLLLLALAGCARAVPTPEPVLLSFACLEQEAAFYEPLAEAYSREHPNVTVQVLPRPYQALQRMEATQADVFALPAGLQGRHERGDLLSLDTWLAGDDSFHQEDLYPGTLELFARNGKIWAIPVNTDVAVMYYNRDLFDERQVPYPRPGWTWEEFLNTAINLADPALGIYGYAAGTSPEEVILFAIARGARIVDDWQDPTRATLDDPRTIDALAWYGDLIYLHNVSPTEEDARRLYGGGQYAIYAGIVGGRIGVWTDMYSSRGGAHWPRGWDFQWGMVAIPRDAQAVTLAQVQALAISAQTEHPEACWRWIDFVTRQVPAQLVPVRRSVADSKAFEQQVGPEAAALARSSLENAMLVPPDLPELYMSLGQAWAEAVGEVVRGEATAAEALVRAQQKANR